MLLMESVIVLGEEDPGNCVSQTWKLWDSLSHGCGDGPGSYCASTGDAALPESETWQKQAKSDHASTFVFMVQNLECLLQFPI